MMRYARVLGVSLLVYQHTNIHCRDQQRREMRRYSSGKHLELSVNPRNPSPRCVSINQRAIHHNIFLLVQKPTASTRRDCYPMSGHGGGGGYRPSRTNGESHAIHTTPRNCVIDVCMVYTYLHALRSSAKPRTQSIVLGLSFHFSESHFHGYLSDRWWRRLVLTHAHKHITWSCCVCACV